jgi:hypothetical protein
LPFAGDVNTTSFLGLIAIAISVVFLSKKSYTNKIKILLLFTIILGFHGLLMGGSRMALLGIVFIFFSMLFRFTKFMTLLFFIILWFLPFWYTPIASNFAHSNILDFLASYSRIPSEASYELITLNRRTETWMIVFTYMVDNFSIFNFFFGYGTEGHAITGVYKLYAFIFPGLSDIELQTKNLHNTPLQVLFNYGFIGFSLFTTIIIKLINDVSKRNEYKINMFIIVLVLIGCFSPVIALNFQYFSFIIILAILFSENNPSNRVVAYIPTRSIVHK